MENTYLHFSSCLTNSQSFNSSVSFFSVRTLSPYVNFWVHLIVDTVWDSVVTQHQIIWQSFDSFSILILTLQHSPQSSPLWPVTQLGKNLIKYSSHIFHLLLFAFIDKFSENYHGAKLKVQLVFNSPLFWLTFDILQYMALFFKFQVAWTWGFGGWKFKFCWQKLWKSKGSWIAAW